MLPVFLYGCETWLPTLREERRLRLLRKIFGPKRDKGTGECRKKHKEEINDFYSSPNIIQVMKSTGVKWVGHVARRGEIYTGFCWGKHSYNHCH
jgi:hypothetical protein